MKIETYEQRILIADEGKYLYNERDNAITTEVYLGINADENEWVEITEEEKLKIEENFENQGM